MTPGSHKAVTNSRNVDPYGDVSDDVPIKPTALAAAALRFVRAELVLLGALALVAAAITLFTGLTEDVLEGDFQAFDQAVLDSVRTPGDPGDPVGPQLLEIALTDLTALGAVAVLAVIVTVVSGFLLIRRRPLAVVALLTALGGGVLLSQGLKLLFGRERPPADFQAAEAINASFPSGHAMLSAIVYLTLGALVAKAMPRRRMKAYVMTVAILLTLIVGLSRIYLGVHWATDVLGGWCVGLAWALACWIAVQLIERWHGRAGLSQPQPPLETQASAPASPAPDDDGPA